MGNPSERDPRPAHGQQEGAEASEFLKKIMDSLSHPVYVIDATTGRVLTASRAARECGLPPFSLSLPGEPDSASRRTGADSPIEELKKLKSPLTLEHVQYEPNEQASVHEIHICPVLDEAGEVRQVIEYHVDVTTRRRAEHALRESEARLRQVVESLPVVLMSRDAATRNMVLLIGTVEEILGYDRQQFLDDPNFTAKIIHPEDVEIVLKTIDESIATKRPYETDARVLHGGDGHVVWVHAQGVPICDEDGELLRIDSILLDVTREKENAQHREQLERRLQQSQKLQSLGVLAGGIAHDFNNLLTIISGNVQFLRESLPHSPAEAKAFADIEAAVRNATEMTRSLQAFSRPTQPRIERIDANSLVQEVHRFLHRLIPAQISFSCALAPSPCPVAADPAQLRQILTQLCINARDAIHNRGSLEIRTRRTAAEELPLRMRDGSESPNYVEIAVSDTGRGMDPQTLSHLFNPFFAGKTKDQGTGLGLAMVYRIVRGHNGLLDVASEPGRGTEVRVYLPEAPPEPAAHPCPVPRPPSRGTERVLVVDDEEMIASLIKTLLESKGYRVSVAHRPEQAIALAETAEQPMDLAVIDYGLPGMGGDECLRKLRGHWPNLKTLLITGSPVNPADLGLPDVRVLEKPFSSQSITQAVRAALDEPSRTPRS